jgi:hypothetical protein
MSRKVSTAPRKTSRRRTISSRIKHLYSSVSGIKKLPRASIEGCVLVPFALTACIPESAVRKFAAKKPFVVHVDDGLVEFSVLYLGDRH